MSNSIKTLIGVNILALLLVAVSSFAAPKATLLQRVETLENEVLGGNFGGVSGQGGVFKTDVIATPNTNTASEITYKSTRRCEVGGGTDLCAVTNNSGAIWIVTPRILLDGTPTTTKAQISIATSSSALATSWPNGYATTTGAWAPLKITLGATTSAGQTTPPTGRVPQIIVGTTTTATGVMNGLNAGVFSLKPGQRVNCTVTGIGRDAGDAGFWEKATSSSFSYRPVCVLDITATSSPKEVLR